MIDSDDEEDIEDGEVEDISCCLGASCVCNGTSGKKPTKKTQAQIDAEKAAAKDPEAKEIEEVKKQVGLDNNKPTPKKKTEVAQTQDFCTKRVSQKTSGRRATASKYRKLRSRPRNRTC